MNIKEIMENLVVIDGHTDIPRDVYLKEKSGRLNVFMEDHYRELKRSWVNIVFVNIFTKGPPEDSIKDAMLQIEKIVKVSEENEDVVLIRDKVDLDYVLETKKMGLVLCLEGFEPLDGHLELLNIYYKLGVRSGMLTWNGTNPFACGVDQVLGGLSDLGKLAIKRMNELGMLVDVSHLNEEGFWDIVKSNKGPTIASHSNARSLFNHKRNLTDEQILAISESGGVIGAVSYFSKVEEDDLERVRLKDDETETIHDYIKHIEYLVNLVGYDHVAFGFDFNMYLGDFGVNGLESAENIQDVIELLLKRGHKIEDVKKIAGGNWIKMLEKM